LINEMDRRYRLYIYGLKNPEWTPFKNGALPSDFFARNVFLCFQEDDLAIRIRGEIGFDRLMWGSDYPHGSGTFPRSRELIDITLGNVSPDERDRLVCRNAADLFGFRL
jgi:predicted TIM-barrel fold metal-dependent hydrolase